MSTGFRVLIHAGELQQIVQALKKSGYSPTRGCLFGLWRNSMKQLVVQFVTDSGKNGIFNSQGYNPDSEYENRCAKTLKEKHAMMKVGYWFSGSPNDYSNVFQHFDEPSCNVLLFINLSPEELSGSFYLKTETEENESHLFKEDILPGDSSFRLSSSLTREIAIGAKYSCYPKDYNSLLEYIDRLPSRTRLEPNTHKEQWYATEGGEELLQLLFVAFDSKSIKVVMSRDATTHNLQFTLNESYYLNFPVDFPIQKPEIFPLRDSGRRMSLKFEYTPGDKRSVCDGLLDSVTVYLRRA